MPPVAKPKNGPVSGTPLGSLWLPLRLYGGSKGGVVTVTVESRNIRGTWPTFAPTFALGIAGQATGESATLANVKPTR